MRNVLMAVVGLVLAVTPAAALPPVSTTLTPLAVSATTGEKPQSKVWTYAGRWWCVMPNATGTWVWRLDGAAWTNVLQLSASAGVHADVKVAAGGVSHVLLFDGASSQLASIEYVAGTQSYQLWTVRPGNVGLPLDGSTETATIDVDTQGRMWLASDHAAGTDQIVVYYADAPYDTWSGPVVLASGIAADDIAVVTAMPGGQVGVMWSNQDTRLFGFRVHVDGADPGVWSADEEPASQSALPAGLGMADDHLNVAVASDGTLYAAVKTSYDLAGYPKMALLVRRPGGTWDDLYEVDEAGTRGIVLLDETAGTLTMLYTSTESAGNILYKETPTSAISMSGPSTVLMPGGLNDVTSTKQNIAGSVVILAGDGSSLEGRLLTTASPPGPLAWWKMDGNVDDSSGNVHHATAYGSPGYVTGMDGQALSLSGSGQYAAGPDDPALRMPGNALTLATWVRPTVEGTQNLVSKSTNGGVGGYELCLAATSSTWPHRAFFRLNQVPSGDTYRINSTTQYSDHLNTWIHLAGTYDGATMKLYVNGVLESSLPAAITINQNTLPVGIGAQVDAANAGTRFLAGGLDDTRIYDRALSDAEVAALAGALPPVTHTITASAGAGGTITPSGAVVVNDGASQVFTIAANAGYHVADVLVDAASVGAVTSHTFNNVTADHTIAASFAPDAPAGDLVGRWRMDEGSGTLVADDSPNGLDGTAIGNPAWVPGVEGPFALSFTINTSQYVQVPDAAALDVTEAITLAAWIRPTQVATASIVNKATFATNPIVYGYELDLSSTGFPFVRLFNDTQAPGGGRLNATIPYPTNGTTWMHVAATYDRTTIKLYVNGVLNVTRASTSAIPANDLPFVIGAPSNGAAARVFPGAIDDARLYSRALTDAEIAAIASLAPTWTITASAGPGGSITPSGSVAVAAGANQGFTIAPNTGYHIADVLVDGASVGPVASHTFTNVTEPHTIAASFAIDVLEITATAGAGGAIAPAGSVPVNYGADQAFTITPASCYAIADVLVDGASVGAVPGYTFTSVTTTHTIAASFVPLTLTITASAGANGSITPAGPQVVGCGTDLSFTIAADLGYHVADVLVDGGSIGAVTSHTFTNIQASHTIAASFAQDPAPGDLVGWWPFEEGSGSAISDASGNGNHGTLPNGASWAAGVDGLAIGLNGTNQRGIVPDSPTLDITGAITLATWVKPQRMTTQHLLHKGNNGQNGYEISLATAPTGANGRPFVRFNNQTNGNLYRLDGTQLYPFDGNTWFHLAATYDGTTIKLYVNGVLDSSQAASFTIAANNEPLGIGSQSDGQFLLQGSMDDARIYGRALSDAEIAALAYLPPVTHTITASAGTGGSISPSGAVVVNDGADATFTITPAACHDIADVLVDGASVGAVTSHTFTGVTADHTIAASFTAKPPYTITASAGPGGSISPNGAVSVACGTDQAFTIAAASGYVIADVLVDGASVGAVASHTFTDVQAAHTIAASFTDVTPPGISAVTAVPGALDAVVYWTTDEPATSRVDYGTVLEPLLSNESSATLETSHGVALAGLTPGTNYYYRVTSVDGTGNAVTYPAPPAPPLSFTTTGPAANNVAAVTPGGAVITTLNPCLTVPVVLARTDVTPIRGYSVTIELSANLTLCGAQVTSGGYLLEPTNLLVTPQAGNRWRIDDVTLGSPCGATGSGTIFNLSVASSVPTGSGTIAVVSVLARDCNNVSVPVAPGLTATVPIDQEGPAATADLVAVQVKSGNYTPPPATHATTAVRLEFTLPPDAASVEVYRRPFGHYPQYDEAGGAEPSPPVLPLDPAWVLTGITASGQLDEPAARDFWYYALVTRDAYGNASAFSNMTSGVLNYHLGDFSDGLAACAGDDLVNTADVSLLGSHYGEAVGVNGPLECVDVGPTMNLSTNGRPSTDNQLEFEDLMMVALNYDAVSAPQGPARIERAAAADAGPDRLVLGAPGDVTVGETFSVPIRLEAHGDLQGLSVHLVWNTAVARPLQVQSGLMFEESGGVVFRAGPGAVDGALLGVHATGLVGEGVFATVTFEALATGDPAVDVATVRVRDRENQPLPIIVTATTSAAPQPLRTRLAPARPNPFRAGTALEYDLARGGTTELAVFSIDGRRVRTLVRGEQEAGAYRLAWDGLDDRGGRLQAGVYFARLTTEEGGFTQTLVLLK